MSRFRSSDRPRSNEKRPDRLPDRAFHRKELERWIIGVALGALGVEQLGTRLVERSVLA